MKLTEVGVLAAVNEAKTGEDSVIARSAVALAQDKTVPILPFRIFRVQAHMIMENAGHKLHG